MTLRLLVFILAALLAGCAAVAPPAPATPACAASAARAPADPRIRLAIDEARRQHHLFGSQTVERDGGVFRAGFHEAGWSRPTGESMPAWRRVSEFWQALDASEPPSLLTTAGRVSRAEAVQALSADGGGSEAAQLAIHEALLRAVIIDTPWSAAFISYLMKTAGFARAEFEFSDSHSDYVRAAIDASAAEAEGREATHAFRACDAATTTPRAGDLLCATRAGTAGTTRFDELAAALAARPAPLSFPMHCDLVVRSDEAGDGSLEAIGGNVLNSVTLSRMALDGSKVLSEEYIARTGPDRDCAPGEPLCRGHLSRRPWLVVLQFRR